MRIELLMLSASDELPPQPQYTVTRPVNSHLRRWSAPALAVSEFRKEMEMPFCKVIRHFVV
jgi:hypothetical protein